MKNRKQQAKMKGKEENDKHLVGPQGNRGQWIAV